MEITKSSRHQKIIGDLGEALLCNWLSKSGFEVTIVDHTGLDIVAFHTQTKRRLGITVKSRTRHVGTENASVNLLSYRKDRTYREKLLAACEAFSCEPWLAVYVESADKADLYLTSLEHFDRTYRSPSARAVDTWRMDEKHRQLYDTDPDVNHVAITFGVTNWQILPLNRGGELQRLARGPSND